MKILRKNKLTGGYDRSEIHRLRRREGMSGLGGDVSKGAEALAWYV